MVFEFIIYDAKSKLVKEPVISVKLYWNYYML